MVIRDANIISVPMKPGANPAVQNWRAQQFAEFLLVTTTNLAELLNGIEIMPSGKRNRRTDNLLMISKPHFRSSNTRWGF